MSTLKPGDAARELLRTLVHDRETTLLKLDRYVRGQQDQPYMPDNADAEYELLAERSITNVMPFIASSSVQAMYVDDFRRGDSKPEEGEAVKTAISAEVKHWQRSRLDARQHAIYRGALNFGHAFTLTEKLKKGVTTKGLSALRTSAIYDDPANDETPLAALTVIRWPKAAEGNDKPVPGIARMWDDRLEYEVAFDSTEDFKKTVRVREIGKHGASECPVTRFTAAVDLEGRTCGVVEPMIPLQDRINQTVFDMLVVQSYASFKVRTISGMAPPVQMRPLDENQNEVKDPVRNADDIYEWVPKIGPGGKPIPEPVNLNAKRVFWAEDENTKFGTLDETPLDGFIEAIKLAFQHMAALSQTPPHHLLGQIANLSAEALIAAETALSRRVEEFTSSFGESWERVFRLAAELEGNEITEADFMGEVIWRDMDSRSLAQSADALGKLAESLGIPKRALWARVPGVTSGELRRWDELHEEDDVDRQIAGGLRRGLTTATTGATRPGFRQASPPTADPAVA